MKNEESADEMKINLFSFRVVLSVVYTICPTFVVDVLCCGKTFG